MAIAKAKRGSVNFGGISRSLGKALSLRNGSRFLTPEEEMLQIVTSNHVVDLKLKPMSDLDLMIANGYGSIPQSKLPENWRTIKRNGTPA